MFRRLNARAKNSYVASRRLKSLDISRRIDRPSPTIDVTILRLVFPAEKKRPIINDDGSYHNFVRRLL